MSKKNDKILKKKSSISKNSFDFFLEHGRFPRKKRESSYLFGPEKQFSLEPDNLRQKRKDAKRRKQAHELASKRNK